MSIFLITFLSLYGGMHVYAFFRIRTLLPATPIFAYLLIGWMMLMTIAPLITRLAERADMERTAMYIAWPGYSWMGFIFLFTVSMGSMDILRRLLMLAGNISERCTISITTANATTIALVLAVTASIYAAYEANHIQPEYVAIQTRKLPATTKSLRIVQISDVHVGLLMTHGRLERIAAVIRDARPDILVSTGDLVDGRLGHDEQMLRHIGMARILADLPAPLGKFAVTGNHEFYAGLNSAVRFTNAAGFNLLRNQSIQLPGGIAICGVDDPAGNSLNKSINTKTEPALLHELPEDRFRLLLKHRPVVPPESDGHFDLQLSGHVHKGQLFPFNMLVHLSYPIPCGTTQTAAKSFIHVSRGSGTWGPIMRLCAPPEVTIIDIIPMASVTAPNK